MVSAGRSEGSNLFSSDMDTTNQVVGEGYAGESIRVQQMSLDSVLHGRACVLWKVDVEGYELEVLSGAVDSLADVNLRVVFLEADLPEISEIMEKNGFNRAFYEPFSRSLEIGSSGSGTGNQLWVRDLIWVQKRCSGAASNMVLGIEF